MNMTFKQWLTYDFPKDEIIFDASGYGLLKILGMSEQYGDPPVTHPVGIARQGKNYILNNNIKQDSINTHKNLCYSSFTSYHDNEKKTRQTCLTNITNLSFVTIDKSLVPFEDYATNLIQHKFCISPEGTGEDCHRHYEAIFFKCIPIINNPSNDYCLKKWGLPSRVKQKYDQLPVLYTDDYRELTESYLNSKYEEILNTTYNFNKLTKTFWKYNSFLLSIQCQRYQDVQNCLPEFYLNDDA